MDYDIFIKVCEYRNYSKVAEVMGLSAHNIVSYKMKKLARRLGVETLFLRDSRGVTPTYTAFELYAKVKVALQAIDEAEAEFCKAHNLPQPSQKILTEHKPTSRLCQSCVGILTGLM